MQPYIMSSDDKPLQRGKEMKRRTSAPAAPTQAPPIEYGDGLHRLTPNHNTTPRYRRSSETRLASIGIGDRLALEQLLGFTGMRT
jgi:hypothetical protein